MIGIDDISSGLIKTIKNNHEKKVLRTQNGNAVQIHPPKETLYPA